MPRVTRSFKAESLELEGRLLLTAHFHTNLPFVGFLANTPPVRQDAGSATLTLFRTYNTVGNLRVEVYTSPNDPAVGVNVGAVDQIVTFANGQKQASLTVPIIAGATNHDHVDVTLHLKPIDPATTDDLLNSEDLRVTTADPPPPTISVSFNSGADIGAGTNVFMGMRIQVVPQNAGEATVTLSRATTVGSLSVKVSTSPSDPAVGVNIGAVDQVITFADGQSQASLRVPILAGAPNPGFVDSSLSVTPVDPAVVNTALSQGMYLRIVASDAALPAKVVSILATQTEIVLTFNKPMDPSSASNVNNYGAVLYDPYLSPRKSTVPFQSASYDPTTHSVTLLPKHKALDIGFQTSVTVANKLPTSARASRRSKANPGLTDAQGTPINTGLTPGKIELQIVNPNFGASF